MCICIVVVLASLALREAKKPALLGKLHLVFAKIGPVPELRSFVFGCIGIAIRWAHALQLHENVQEDMKVFLCLDGKLAFPLFGHVKECTRNGSNLHGLSEC